MKTLYCLGAIFIMLLFVSCQTTAEKEPTSPSPAEAQMKEISSLMFDLSPSEGKLFFFTAVTREQYREKEIKSCRMEAARQYSRYHQINGATYSKTSENTRGTVVTEANGIAFNDDLAGRLVENLELEKEIRTEEGTAALFSVSADTRFKLSYKPAGLNSEPDWINQSIEIPGYQTAVGFTGKKRFLERTLQQADKNALATLLEQRKGQFNATQSDWQSNYGTTGQSSVVEKAAGSIQQAYILSRWIDSKGNFYSLAICPRP